MGALEGGRDSVSAVPGSMEYYPMHDIRICSTENLKVAAVKHRSSYHLITLGCAKNEADSRGMEIMLQGADYAAAPQAEDADVVIVNTCGFLQAAVDESLGVLREQAAQLGRHQTLIAAGCLAQREGRRILKEVPAVKGLLGTRRWMDIVSLTNSLRQARGRRRQEAFTLLGDPEESELLPAAAPVLDGGSAYLKISDGCNAPCSFCTIPSFKGKLRSRQAEALLSEAQALVQGGARELVVVAQDTTDYGRDFGEPGALPRLLQQICRRCGDGLAWVRLMYAYPGHVTPELVETMAAEPRVVPYLDMPLQHGDPQVLRRMRRPHRLELVWDHVNRLRAAMPDIVLRTTFIVGFPGETEAEFQNLLEFLEDVRFDRVGAFQFSREPGTPSHDLPGQVEPEVMEERWHRLMAAQQPISLARNQAQIGRQLEVLVEGHGEDEAGGPVLLGRSYRDAPEVDGLVLIPDAPPAEPGDMLSVHVTGAMPYDLIGEALRPETFASDAAPAATQPLAFT